jgi:hemerythrin
MTDTLFKWDDSFLIGIEEVDHEHKLLIHDINRLHKELVMHDKKPEIEECLGDIYARMQAHFALEEHIMKEYGYEHFDEHKHEHEELLGSYTECMVQFLNDTGVSSSNHIEDCLRDWVIKHIVDSDKRMGLIIQEKESFKSKLRK